MAMCTLGCKVNQYDTDAVATQFVNAGYKLVDFEEQADVYVINTCTVTNVGDRKSRQMIRRAHRRNPEAKIVVMGCLAQTSPDEIQKIDGVNLLVGTDERGKIVELVSSLDSRETTSIVDDIFTVKDFEELPVTTFGGRTRAMLKIQDGCNQFCSYCRVPYARGRSRSRLPENVIHHAEDLVKQGYKEIVLTGVHLGAYGQDLKPALHLTDVAGELANIPGLSRLRIGSIDPHEITPEFLELVATNPVVCRHLHIPLQSGCNGVLERMRRKYSTEEYRTIINEARRMIPGLAVTTDVIVGFPGETDQEFTEALEFVQEMAFSRLHVFKYSKRANTLAAKMQNQVPNAVKEERSQMLIALGNRMAEQFHHSLVGKQVEVLVENVEEGRAQGLTDNYVRTEFPAGHHDITVGKTVVIQVTAADEQGIRGIRV